MAKSIQILFVFLLSSLSALAQQGVIKGKILDLQTREVIPFATVKIQNTITGVASDKNGDFVLNDLEPEFYTLEISCMGYEKYTEYEIQAFNNKPVQIEILLKPTSNELQEVVVKPELFTKPIESPNSIRSLGVTEIKRAPGGGQDISRVIQTLPGVATTPASNRNDIIVRGGGPTENSFFVDNFEVSTINHFTTQGASGGVWGIIDANHIKTFDLSTGAFPTYADNMLSSVFNLNLKKGNSEKFETQLNIGTLQRGINFNGHIGKKITFLTGVRQANFDLLFNNRPTIPMFTDAVAKINIELSNKTNLELFCVSAFDNLKYNTDVEMGDENLYLLERVRKIDQTTYTIGTKLTQNWKNGNTKFIYSLNNLNNIVTKYKDNDETQLKMLDYNSTELSHRIDIRNTFYFGNIILTNGLVFKNNNYEVQNHSYQVSSNGIREVDFTNNLSILNYGIYGNASREFLNKKLAFSIGFRLDANNYSEQFSNPFAKFSPRISVAYQITNNFKINANSGIYYQNPSLTSLGYKENNVLINKENKIKPIQNTQFVVGAEYNTKFNSSFSVESFYKNYKNYPVSVNDQISLANLSAGFGVFGDEELVSTSEGRSYGVELFYQQKLFKGFYGMMSYTWVKSEFTNGNETYTASSWDYRNIFSITLGKSFKGNWEIGAKWVYYGGIPYTPYDETASAIKSNWDYKNQGILDFSKLNQLRTGAYHQLDIRIDKKFFFKKWNLNLFADIQNVYDFVGGVAPSLILDRDNNFLPQTDPNNSNAYLLKYAETKGFGIRPNIGLIIEF